MDKKRSPYKADLSEEQRKCYVCGKKADKECPVCGLMYDTDDCQRRDWPSHSKTCGKVPLRKWGGGGIASNDFDAISKNVNAYKNKTYVSSYKPERVIHDPAMTPLWAEKKLTEEYNKDTRDSFSDITELKNEIEYQEKQLEKKEKKQDNEISSNINRERRMVDNAVSGRDFLLSSSSSDSQSEADNDEEDNASDSDDEQNSKASAKNGSITTKSAWSMSTALTAKGERGLADVVDYIKNFAGSFVSEANNLAVANADIGGSAHEVILYDALRAAMLTYGRYFMEGVCDKLIEKHPSLLPYYQQFVSVDRLNMGLTWVDITVGPVDMVGYDISIYAEVGAFVFSRVAMLAKGFNTFNEKTGLLFDSFHGKFVYWHSMSPSLYNTFTNRELREIIIKQAKEWFIYSCRPMWLSRHPHPNRVFDTVFIPDLFCLGHIVHMVSDSFARGHIHRLYYRDEDNNLRSVIRMFNDYRVTSENIHKKYDSIAAYRTSIIDQKDPTGPCMRMMLATLFDNYADGITYIRDRYEARAKDELDRMLKERADKKVKKVISENYTRERNLRVKLSHTFDAAMQREIQAELDAIEKLKEVKPIKEEKLLKFTQIAYSVAIKALASEFFDNVLDGFFRHVVYELEPDYADQMAGQFTDESLTQSKHELEKDEQQVRDGILPPRDEHITASADAMLAKPTMYYCTKGCWNDDNKYYPDRDLAKKIEETPVLNRSEYWESAQMYKDMYAPVLNDMIVKSARKYVSAKRVRKAKNTIRYAANIASAVINAVPEKALNMATLKSWTYDDVEKAFMTNLYAKYEKLKATAVKDSLENWRMFIINEANGIEDVGDKEEKLRIAVERRKHNLPALPRGDPEEEEEGQIQNQKRGKRQASSKKPQTSLTSAVKNLKL